NNNNNFNGANSGPVYLEGDGGVPNGQYQNNNYNGANSFPVYQEGDGGYQQNNNWNQPNINNGRYINQQNNNYNNNNQYGSNGFNGWETISSVGYGSVPMELAWRAARQEINQNFYGQQLINPLIPISIPKAQKNGGGDVELEVVYAEGNCFGAKKAGYNGSHQVDLSLISNANCVQKPLGQRMLYSVSERQGRRGGSKITVRRLRDVANGEVILG
ncbi:hypothetical protein PMAYCL1PPCAC_06336, partial [Pristionchus mayeri]